MESEKQRLGAWEVLMLYFGPDAEGRGRAVTTDELRQLSINERKELAREAAKQLGVELLG
jgi:adenylate kinase